MLGYSYKLGLRRHLGHSKEEEAEPGPTLHARPRVPGRAEGRVAYTATGQSFPATITHRPTHARHLLAGPKSAMP